MQRFYVFSPALGKFLSWDGVWRTFTGAKDYISLHSAQDAAKISIAGGQTLIFELHE
jgi:hypothetical protein